MSIEEQRFRAWDQSSQAKADKQWLLIAKYNAIRIIRSPLAWVLGGFSLLLLAPAFVTLNLFSQYTDKIFITYDFSDYGTMITLISVAAIAVLGSANFSDDVRFNSLLFYFSRPLRAPDYLWGKLMGLATIIASYGFILILSFAMVFIDGSPGVENENSYEAFVRNWGQAIWLASMAVFGFFAFNIYALGTISVLSLYAKRGWHALLGWVVLHLAWSFIWAILFSPFKEPSAAASIFSPFGWFVANTLYPYQRLTEYETLGAIPVYQAMGAGIALVIGVSSLLFCLNRLKKMEGTV